MPEPTPQLEQELAAQPVVAAPAAAGAAPMGAFSAPMAAAVRAFGSGHGLPSGFGTPQVSALQRSAGNQVVARLVAPPMFVARQPAPAAAPAPPSPGAGPTTAGPSPAGQTPNPPTAANPSSGISWDSIWEGENPNIIRTFLEIARLYPGWGLLAGGAADLMNAKQDFDQIAGVDAPEIEAFMYGRHAVAILNNGLGHVIYVVQLVQDIATASVVGAEVDAVTIPLNELLLGIKVGVDSVQFLTDFGLTCAAQYRSMKAPPGPAGAAERGKWDGMVANYEANLLGDLLTGIFDIIDLSSAGFANAGPVKQGAKAVKATFDTAKFVKGLVKSVLQGWFGVWGGKAFEQGRLGGPIERGAGAMILAELQQMKLAYTVGDALIGAAADHIAKQLTELNAATTVALGGKDPFITARDEAVKGLGNIEQRIQQMGQMSALATTAKEKSTAIETWAAETRATIDSVQVPDIQIPEADVGDDPLSDLAEGAMNLAGDIAGAGLQLLVDQLNEGVDELKSMLTPPVDTIKDNATELGQFMQVVTDEAKEQIGTAQTRVADIKGKLAKCNSFEEVVNLIIQQIFDMVGLESDFEVDDIRKLWVEVGTMIDEGIVWAEGLASGQFREPPAGAAAGPGATPEGAPAPGASGSAAAGAPGSGAAGSGAPGTGGDPAAGRSSVPAGAAAAAGSSPPSAAPSGAAAGRDLAQPGAAAGAAGGGAPALDPASFIGAAAAGASTAAGAAAGAAAGPAGAMIDAAAGAAGAAASAGSAAATPAGAAAAGAAAGVAEGAAAAAGGPVGAAAGAATGALGAAGGLAEGAASAAGGLAEGAASAAGGLAQGAAAAAGAAAGSAAPGSEPERRERRD
jgi:hypothetical protein